jgi:hypothetical protein
LADLRISRAAPLKWGISVIESGENPVILSNQAREALAKAAETLTGNIPGRRPDAERARAWAEIGQGWAALSYAQAARSIAAAAFAVDQGGVTIFPGP